jgi:hypothetical protein
MSYNECCFITRIAAKLTKDFKRYKQPSKHVPGNDLSETIAS